MGATFWASTGISLGFSVIVGVVLGDILGDAIGTGSRGWRKDMGLLSAGGRKLMGFSGPFDVKAEAVGEETLCCSAAGDVWRKLMGLTDVELGFTS